MKRLNNNRLKQTHKFMKLMDLEKKKGKGRKSRSSNNSYLI
jgi:hypothetical protein